MKHFILTRSVSEETSYRPRLRFGLVSHVAASSIGKNQSALTLTLPAGKGSNLPSPPNGKSEIRISKSETGDRNRREE